MKKRTHITRLAGNQNKEDVLQGMSALSDHLVWAADMLQGGIKALREEIKGACPPAEGQPPAVKTADVLDLCRQLDEECAAKNRALAWAAELEDRLRAVGEKPPRRTTAKKSNNKSK